MSIFQNENGVAVQYSGSGGSGGSGGHTIINSNGITMAQRNKLRFINADVTDDATNNQTVVSVGAAAKKSVDDAISTTPGNNLPTSSAVASFVEGKGYLTEAPVTSVNGQTGDVNITALTFHILRQGEDLPETGVVGDLYFKPNGSQSGTNLYDEWTDLDGAGSWENLGSIGVDLSNYVTLNGNEALSNKTINGYTPREAMGKGVDTSILDGSTSTALPTSAAVAAFVEGKGYGTSNFSGDYTDLTNKPTLGTAAAKDSEIAIDTGSSSTNLPTAAAVASFVEGKGYLTEAPVTSVNGQTGDVTITLPETDASPTSESTNAVQSGGVYTALQGKQNNDTWVTRTLSASNWSNSQYSLESIYPSTTYDIINVLPNSSTSSTQRNAWIKADCGGYNTSNIIIAHGTVPTIDINISLCIRVKN